MGHYGKIYDTYWTSPDIAPLQLETKAVGAYLLSSPHANMLGCYRLPVAYAIDDLKCSSETVVKGFAELSRVGFAIYDSNLSWVLIRRFLLWNPLQNPNQGKSAAKLVAEVPRISNVYAALVEILRANPAHFPEGFINGLETVPEESRNQYLYLKPYLHPDPELKDTSPSALAGSDEPPESPPLQKPATQEKQAHRAAVERLFSFYCEATGRNPRRYSLTPVRVEKALARFRERLKVHDGDTAAAERDLAEAIENLAASEWHRANGFTDWEEQIFRSTDEFERRLNWQPPTAGEKQHGNTHSGSHLDQAEREALQLLAGGTSGHSGAQALR